MLAYLDYYAQNLIQNIGKFRYREDSRGDLPRTLVGAVMRNSIISTLAGLTLVALSVSAPRAEDARPELQDNPPERYAVTRGDTLWGISKRYLKNPWRWPDLWGMNKEEVRNPHLIYPGNVLVFDMSSGQPRLRLEGDGPGGLAEVAKGTGVGSTVKLSPRVRSEQLSGTAVRSISASVINPFLNRPLIVAPDPFEHAPRIVATPENRVLVSDGDIAYVEGITKDSPPLWQVYRPSKPLIDPTTKEVLGFEVLYLADAQVRDYGGVSTVKILRARQEVGVGDRLVLAPPSDILAYVPRAAKASQEGQVISAPDTVISEIGQQQIIVLNVGARNGVETGQVFALYRSGIVSTPRRLPSSTSNDPHRAEIVTVQSEFDPKKVGGPVTLPDERYGITFVFRVFEKVSYALVMNAARPVNLLDRVKAP